MSLTVILVLTYLNLFNQISILSALISISAIVLNICFFVHYGKNLMKDLKDDSNVYIDYSANKMLISKLIIPIIPNLIYSVISSILYIIAFMWMLPFLSEHIIILAILFILTTITFNLFAFQSFYFVLICNNIKGVTKKWTNWVVYFILTLLLDIVIAFVSYVPAIIYFIFNFPPENDLEIFITNIIVSVIIFLVINLISFIILFYSTSKKLNARLKEIKEINLNN